MWPEPRCMSRENSNHAPLPRAAASKVMHEHSDAWRKESGADSDLAQARADRSKVLLKPYYTDSVAFSGTVLRKTGENTVCAHACPEVDPVWALHGCPKERRKVDKYLIVGPGLPHSRPLPRKPCGALYLSTTLFWCSEN